MRDDPLSWKIQCSDDGRAHPWPRGHTRGGRGRGTGSSEMTSHEIVADALVHSRNPPVEGIASGAWTRAGNEISELRKSKKNMTFRMFHGAEA